MNSFAEKLLQQARSERSQLIRKDHGMVAWQSPSNIAIVKYWGKYPGQVPANASLSLTLSNAVTKMSVAYTYSDKIAGPKVELEFEGRKELHFEKRVVKFLQSVLLYLPWLKYTELKIETENTFPHSSGIASSASSMSALASSLCEIEGELFADVQNIDIKQKASFLSRLGSGSASRSIYADMAVWGLSSDWPLSSDEYAIQVEGIHDNFIGLKDSILIIEAGKKEVSSSLGHDLMKSNIYANLRFKAAEQNMQGLRTIIAKGDIGQFIDIMESEALSLHAMMMTSNPGYILMKPNTIEAIQRIRKYRNSSGKHIGFTLDAGANVHVLYTTKQERSAKQFIDQELSQLCVGGMVIHDEMGKGAAKLF